MTNVDEVHERPQKQARLLAEDEVTDDPFSKQLTWRMDPETSFSDWTLQVSHDDSILDEIDTYHVHKVILAVGPRRSEYFANCFVQSMQEQMTNTTKVTYSRDMAALFPILLDYIYGGCTGLFSNPQQAIGAYKLADYFQIQGLGEESVKYLDAFMAKMSITDFPMLFHDLLETESLLKRATEKLAKYAPRLTDTVACQLPIDILLSLIEQARIDAFSSPSSLSNQRDGYFFGLRAAEQEAKEQRMSALIVSWLEQNRESLTSERFQEILGILLNYTLNSISALTLLIIEGMNSDELQEDAPLTQLQTKCVKLVAEVERFRENSRMKTEVDLLQRLRLLPKHILCHILARSKW